MVRINDNRYGEFTPLLDKAMQAYTDGLGSRRSCISEKNFRKNNGENSESCQY